jgi:hypothetical protein
MTLTEVKSHYSQAKLELYGLFCALRAVRIYLFGITNLMVEVDAKYIKGMINNPILQPNTTINRWIVVILLFFFELVHVSASKHTGADGLSRRPPADEDPLEEDDHEDWLDRSYSFGIEILNDQTCHTSPQPHSSPAQCLLTCPPTFLACIGTVTTVGETEEIPHSEAAETNDAKLKDIQCFLTD